MIFSDLGRPEIKNGRELGAVSENVSNDDSSFSYFVETDMLENY